MRDYPPGTTIKDVLDELKIEESLVGTLFVDSSTRLGSGAS